MSNPKLIYYPLNPEVTAFSSTRHGGFSKGAYSDFNINEYCGDDSTNISQNRDALCETLSIAPARLIMPHQIHDTKSIVIDESFLQQTPQEQKRDLEGIDAVITNRKDVCIGVSTADCVPILLYDTYNKVAAAIHAGWRGTCSRIIECTIDRMYNTFGSKGKDIAAVIGPSISLSNFEVGDEVYEAFQTANFPMEKISRMENGKWHIDLWESNRLSLLNKNVPANHIKVSGICTYDNDEDFFSARKLTINSGRIFSGIIIRSL